ncbi:KEOPS complex subunit Cgi121 [[Eubacterium] cellulosolvens]
MFEVLGAKVKSTGIDPEVILKRTLEFSKDNELVIQLFNADFVYGKDHLISAFEHAERAFAQKTAISSTLGMEILLYASGEYQIMNAINKVGITKDTKSIAIALQGEVKDLNSVLEAFFAKLKSGGIELERDDGVLVGDKNTLERFGISKDELAAVPEDRWLELVLEKVALLDIIK